MLVSPFVELLRQSGPAICLALDRDLGWLLGVGLEVRGSGGRDPPASGVPNSAVGTQGPAGLASDALWRSGPSQCGVGALSLELLVSAVPSPTSSCSCGLRFMKHMWYGEERLPGVDSDEGGDEGGDDGASPEFVNSEL
jgi:hypothetical protein